MKLVIYSEEFGGIVQRSIHLIDDDGNFLFPLNSSTFGDFKNWFEFMESVADSELWHDEILEISPNIIFCMSTLVKREWSK